MSIAQTVIIPASLASEGKRQLTIDVPPEVPAGPVILTFTPQAAEPLVHAKTPPVLETEASFVAENSSDYDARPWERMRGCCKGHPGASVEEFLARCHADKEHELAIEKRQQEESARWRHA